MKTTRFSLLAAFILLIAGCGSQNDGPNISSADGSPAKSGIFSLFDPVVGTIPFPFDALFIPTTGPSAGKFTGTINIPHPPTATFVAAANLQDGFSTVASAFTDLLGFVDFATAATGGLIVVDGSTGAPLVQGTDYLLQTSTAKDDATGIPISSTRTRILIEPLKPLKPSTTYIVALTVALKSTDGLPVAPSDAFKVVRSSISVPTQASDTTNPNYAYLQTQSPAAQATLETLRSQLIRPTVAALMSATGNPEEAFALAWSFTTQAINDTLTIVNTNAAAKPLTFFNTGLQTNSPPLNAPAGADVYVGTLASLPYYLSNNISAADTPLNSYWKNNGVPAGGNFGPTKFNPDPAKRIPCAVFSSAAVPVNPNPSVIAQDQVTSTTACFPTPVKQSDETIPALATVPNATGCPTGMPAGGWPVAIFQHGITGNRSQMLAIAPALAKACIVTIAIDLPLHGITDQTNPLYNNQVFASTPASFLVTTERTFNLDLVNNTTGAPGADGTIDSSGTWFINLTSLLTSRDNLRQAAADLITLSKSAPGTVFLTNAGAATGFTVDTSKIYLVGHSLGGIVGGTMLGVDGTSPATAKIKAATLAMPGGGIAKLLDASISFSPRISAGLAASGINKGTDLFETFLRFAQTTSDSGDPINYAVAAKANHPIHMIEVVGDTVVPNNALAGTLASIPGYLSGTDPLYRIMGLTVVGPLNFTATPASQVAGPGTVVKFAQGNHGSILSPAGPVPNASVTCEMQRETVSFLASGGTALPISNACP